MVNVLDCDCPRRIEICRLLKASYDNGFFSPKKKWKSFFEMYREIGEDGRTKQIIKELFDAEIIKRNETHYYFDIKQARSYLLSTNYIKLAEDLGVTIL